MTREQIGEVVEQLVTARATGDDERATEILDTLTRGGSPVVDALNVTMVLAGIMSEELNGWIGPNVPVKLSAHVDAFLGMAFALGGGDRVSAQRKFRAYVGSDWQRALALLVFAANQIAHMHDGCDCDPVSEPVG